MAGTAFPPFLISAEEGSQCTSKRYHKLLASDGMRASKGKVGSCWDKAVVEQLVSSLKHDWLFRVPQVTHEHMKKDVAAYMRYYNLNRLHTANSDIVANQR